MDCGLIAIGVAALVGFAFLIDHIMRKLNGYE